MLAVRFCFPVIFGVSVVSLFPIDNELVLCCSPEVEFARAIRFSKRLCRSVVVLLFMQLSPGLVKLPDDDKSEVVDSLSLLTRLPLLTTATGGCSARERIVSATIAIDDDVGVDV